MNILQDIFFINKVLRCAKITEAMGIETGFFLLKDRNRRLLPFIVDRTPLDEGYESIEQFGDDLIVGGCGSIKLPYLLNREIVLRIVNCHEFPKSIITCHFHPVEKEAIIPSDNDLESSKEFWKFFKSQKKKVQLIDFIGSVDIIIKNIRGRKRKFMKIGLLEIDMNDDFFSYDTEEISEELDREVQISILNSQEAVVSILRKYLCNSYFHTFERLYIRDYSIVRADELCRSEEGTHFCSGEGTHPDVRTLPRW